MANQECIPSPLVQPEPESTAATAKVIEFIAGLQRQVEEKQRVIAQLTTGNNRPDKRANVEAQLERDLPIAQREPLLITWKKAKPSSFHLSTVRLQFPAHSLPRFF